MPASCLTYFRISCGAVTKEKKIIQSKNSKKVQWKEVQELSCGFCLKHFWRFWVGGSVVWGLKVWGFEGWGFPGWGFESSGFERLLPGFKNFQNLGFSGTLADCYTNCTLKALWARCPPGRSCRSCLVLSRRWARIRWFRCKLGLLSVAPTKHWI